MNPVLLFRLALDGVAAGLLLFGLAYWWLGNTAHELAGTLLFLLVVLHNAFNRRWYGAVARTRRDVRRRIDIAVVLLLAAAMLVLLVTSLLISETLAGVLPVDGGFTARRLHTLAAYWALVIVAVHLGLRWPMVMGVARGLCGVTTTGAGRTIGLRLAAAAIAGFGVWSSFELGVGSKLTMRITPDWWNFEESVADFFLHGVAVVGLWTVLTHGAMTGLRRARSRMASGSAVAKDLHQ